MLSASLPPARYSTTSVRLRAPWARARSERNAGAANPTVKAATPSRMNSRRVNFISPRSHELVVARSGEQVEYARGLHGELPIIAGPCPAGADVVEQRVPDLGIDFGQRQPIDREIEQCLRRLAGRA